MKVGDVVKYKNLREEELNGTVGVITEIGKHYTLVRVVYHNHIQANFVTENKEKHLEVIT